MLRLVLEPEVTPLPQLLKAGMVSAPLHIVFVVAGIKLGTSRTPGTGLAMELYSQVSEKKQELKSSLTEKRPYWPWTHSSWNLLKAAGDF